MSQSKGFERERELVNLLDERGFGATRVPKSGGGTKRELPDVLAGNGDVIFAIEAKARKEGYIYLTGREVEGLVFFARNFGARPRIAVRYDYDDWFFFHPADLYTTDGGNYRVSQGKARSNGIALENLAKQATN